MKFFDCLLVSHDGLGPADHVGRPKNRCPTRQLDDHEQRTLVVIE
jgi:hypothetical protein